MLHSIQPGKHGPFGEPMAHAVQACVHCGFCLAVCPTYAELGQEMDSPRGRIVLMKQALEGTLSWEAAQPHIDRCLGCLACEPACPSGVSYRDLISPFRALAGPRFHRSVADKLRHWLAGQTIDAEDLPLKLCGISHCFRTEAGAPGRDTRGLYRVHQFTKVEMFAFTTPDQSEAIHQELLGIEESIFQGLGLPYQVIDTCTGDLGGPAYRKYDIEAWMPGRGDKGEYGEVTSTSNCTDYQSRRLNIRYKGPNHKGTRHVHTLNGTAVAISRAA